MSAPRGLSEDTPVRIGAWYGTCASGAGAAGTSAGRPLRGTWHEADDYDPTGGTTKINAVGQGRNILYPPEQEGGEWPITLEYTQFDPSTLPTLWAQFAANAKPDVVVPLVDGRTWTGKARLDYRGGNPISAPGDHPHHGGSGRSLKIRMRSTEGGY